MTPPPPPTLEISLLGGFSARVGCRVVQDADWRLRKAKHLVKLLALAAGHRLQREQVMELLWPEQNPEAAANNLHKAIYTARRALEPDLRPSWPSAYIRLEWNRVVLDGPAGLRVDVDEFEHAATAAQQSGQSAAYASALDRYAGELLPEDRYEDWAIQRRETLERSYLALLMELAELRESEGQPYAAIEALSRVVAREPVHEEAHVALMRLYAQSGQRYLAVREYQRLRAALRRELDLEPTPAITQLYRDIAAGNWAATARLPASRPWRVDPIYRVAGAGA
jgi:DNA-binding SARP family transcriptional activator